MAIRRLTTDPKPSHKHQGWYYARFNDQLPNGTEKTVLIPPCNIDVLKKNFVFDDSIISKDPTTGLDTLNVGFDQPQSEEPSIPPSENGWDDPDCMLHQPIAPANGNGNGNGSNGNGNGATPQPPSGPNTFDKAGIRPATARRRAAAARAAEFNLDVDLLLLLEQVTCAYNYTCRRIGVAEKPRAMEAQKLVVTALIPYLKATGIALTEEDEKTLQFV